MIMILPVLFTLCQVYSIYCWVKVFRIADKKYDPAKYIVRGFIAIGIGIIAIIAYFVIDKLNHL